MPGACSNLNLLYVGTLPPSPGGAAISCSQLIVGLANRGYTVRAVAPITVEALRAGDSFAARFPGIAVTRYLVPHFEITTSVPPSSEHEAVERQQLETIVPVLIADERPDLVFIGRESFALQVPDLARRHALPVVLSIRGGTTIGILEGTFPEALSRQFLDQYRKADLLVSPARHFADRLRPFGLDSIRVIPNAVDLQQFAPRPKDDSLLEALGIESNDVVVLHLSNLKPLKRPLDIVHSAARALRENPRLVYVIVGDGPCRQAMEAACLETSTSERFRFVGWVEYDRVPNYVNLADMVVMPSEAEGLARVYLEAQACARLLLASDIPPAREVIEDGATGVLFKKGDVDDLAAKTLWAARSPRLRAEIGQRARQRVMPHSLDEAVATYAAVLGEVAQRRYVRVGSSG